MWIILRAVDGSSFDGGDVMSALLGRMDLSYLPHEPATIGAAIGMPLILIILVGLLTYYKKWGWLWRERKTTTADKRIKVVALAAIVMLVRGVADAFMLRVQTAGGGPGGHQVFSTDTFQQVFSAHGTIMIFFVAMGRCSRFNIAGTVDDRCARRSVSIPQLDEFLALCRWHDPRQRFAHFWRI